MGTNMGLYRMKMKNWEAPPSISKHNIKINNEQVLCDVCGKSVETRKKANYIKEENGKIVEAVHWLCIPKRREQVRQMKMKLTKAEKEKLSNLLERVGKLKDEIMERRDINDIDDVDDSDVIHGLDGVWAELYNVCYK